MNRIKAALFDLDGVVFDTEPQYTIFWRKQCVEFHPEIPGLENKIKGQTLVEIYDKYFSGNLLDKREVVSQRLADFEQRMSYDYIQGFVPFVLDARLQNIKTAVVTSSNRAKMENVYRTHSDFLEMFDAVLTSEDFVNSKPAPDCYLEAANRFGFLAEECIVFEDSFNGLMSGRNAGMTVVGLSTTNKREAIDDYSDIVIDNYIGLTINNLFK